MLCYSLQEFTWYEPWKLVKICCIVADIGTEGRKHSFSINLVSVLRVYKYQIQYSPNGY